LDRISPNLIRAVIASEDTRFCLHAGFDLRELLRAMRALGDGRRPRGASTLSNQTAKNVFLIPERAYIRKALEIPLTFGIEMLWSKRRILEVYLNNVEWGRGIYGAEAAARHHFGVSAAKLSEQQAALLAVSLPNPRLRQAGAPSEQMRSVAAVVLRRMARMRTDGPAVCPWRW
jgi:monofunctional biosynthetic peptidoglycan transglycosylase